MLVSDSSIESSPEKTESARLLRYKLSYLARIFCFGNLLQIIWKNPLFMLFFLPSPKLLLSYIMKVV